MNRDAYKRAAMMKGQFKKATSMPEETFKYWMDPADMNRWYVVISNIAGDNNEFVGGEYLIRIELPGDFPLHPPEFYIMTPNGVYGTECKVCVSIGTFHKKDYPATQGVAGFVMSLMSGIVGWQTLGTGIQILTEHKSRAENLATMTHHAKNSVNYNRTNHRKIIESVEESYRDCVIAAAVVKAAEDAKAAELAARQAALLG